MIHISKLFLISLFIAAFASCTNKEKNILPEEDRSQFVLITDVIPDAILEIRYYSTYNFIGERIPGYIFHFPNIYKMNVKSQRSKVKSIK